jgi:FkbM family methyltransferase
MVRIGDRSLRQVSGALFQMRHYRALINSFKVYERPLNGLFRYLTGRGEYPYQIALRTSTGVVSPTLFCRHDMLTVNEIFCRNDYECITPKVVVDFGSNIGISATYFLSRHSETYCYLFEPLPQNIDRLKANLKPFEGRFTLTPCAVGTSNGEVSFGYEPTGRYGGIGLDTGTTTMVACRAANEVLAEILAKHGEIDILKVDIEAFEKEIIDKIPIDMKLKIKTILVEQQYDSNPYERIYRFHQYGPIARFEKI